MSNEVGRLYILFDANGKPYIKGLDDINRETERWRKKTETAAEKAGKKIESTLTDYSRKAGLALSIGLGVAVVSMAKTAASFEYEFSRIKANAGATSGEIAKLRDVALKLGKDTAFSASEAAQAANELVKAGLDVNQTIAALPGMLDLAAAGELDVAQAAEITANALSAFNLQASQAGTVADTLALGANKSTTEVTLLADSFNMVASAASTSGWTIQETTSALALMANEGHKGSDAGTSLKQMFMQLMSPSDKARQLMDQYGISLYDANGKTVSAVELLKRLETGLSGLTQEQRDYAIATIFGTDAMRAANDLMKAGVSGFEAMTRSVSKTGAAHDIAAEKLDNFYGSLEQLKGSIETFAIKVGTPLINALRPLVDLAAALPEPIMGGALALTAFATAGTLVVGFLPKLIEGYKTLKEGWSTFAAARALPIAWASEIGAVLGPIGLLVTAIATVGTISKQVTDATAAQREALVANTTTYREYAAALGEAGAYEIEGMIRNEASREQIKLTSDQMVEATNIAGWMARSVEGLTGAQYYESLALAVQIASGKESIDVMQDRIDEYNKANSASVDAAEAADLLGVSQESLTKEMILGAAAAKQLATDWENIKSSMDDINLIEAWSDATNDAKDAAREHASALGLEGDALSSYVDGASASLTQWLAQLEEQARTMTEKITNLATIRDKLVAAGLTDTNGQAFLDFLSMEADPQMIDKLAQGTIEDLTDAYGYYIEEKSPETQQKLKDALDISKRVQQMGAEDGEAGATSYAASWNKTVSASNLPDSIKDVLQVIDLKDEGTDGAKSWMNAFTKQLTILAGQGVIANALGVLNTASATAGKSAAGDMDPNFLMQMLGPGVAGQLTGMGGLSPTTESAWRRLVSVFPYASWMGGYAKEGHIKNSDHYTGHAFDVGGAGMHAMSRWMSANAASLGIKYLIYNKRYWGPPQYDWNTPYTGSNPHTDHVHVSTYDSGGVLPPGTTLATNYTGQNEVVLPADWIDKLTGEIGSLVDAIRKGVNADTEVAKGLKGITANQQILDAFSSRSSLADSYVSRESARLSMQQATGADLATQTATLKREIEFIDKAIAEAELQLATAKSRGMDQAEINRLSQNLSGLQQNAAEARDDLEALARTPLEQAADRWSNAISQTNMMMDLLSNSSSAFALQSSLFPDLMGQLGGGYQNALDLMNASTNPSDIMNYGDQALSGLDSMFSAEKSQLDRALDDTLNSIDSAQDSWENAWEARYEALQDSVDAQEEALNDQLENLDKAQQEELDALTKFYDDRLQIMQDAETAITREQQRNSSQKTLGGLEDELRILQGQGYYTEADIARMRELETQIQEQRDSMAQQEAAWKREDERAALEAEKAAALEKLQAQQEAERVALQDQIDAAQKSLQAQLDAMERERKLQEQQFEQQREQAQQAYQAQLDASVAKYAELMQQVIDAENNLLGETGQYQNAGYALGQSFAQGIIDSIPEIQAAAQLAAQTAADYLELHSPAKLGPLSTLDEWWDAFVPTLTHDFDIADLIQPVMDTYGPSTPVAATATQAVQTIVHTGEEVIRVVLESVVPNDASVIDALADEVSRKIGKRVEVASWGRG